MEERRKSIRIRRPLLLRFKDVAGNFRILCISNLSQEGVCFLNPFPFSQGQFVEVSLKLPSRPNEWHECRCEVLESKDITKHQGAFVSGFLTRAKLDSISERTKTFLKDYCDFATKQNEALEHIFEERLGVWAKESEKRGNIRINKLIMAMYAESSETATADWDVTAIRNISTGGALFTAKTMYKKFTHLQLLIKIPLKPFEWIGFSGKVIESKQLKNLADFMIGGTYLTRIEFSSVPVENRALLEEYEEWFVEHLKKMENPGFSE
jgi:hypothetical protein